MLSLTIPLFVCEQDERQPNEAAKTGGLPPSGWGVKLATSKSAKPQVTHRKPQKRGYLAR